MNVDEIGGRKALKALLAGKAIRNRHTPEGQFFFLADDGYITDSDGSFGEDLDFWTELHVLKGKIIEMVDEKGRCTYRLEI